MIPTHQRLRAGQNRLFRTNVIFGLEVHHKTIAFQGRLEVLQQTLSVKLCLMHLRIINTNGLPIAVPYGIRGNLRIIKAALNLERLIYLRVDTHAQADAVRRDILIHKPLRGLVQDALIFLPVRTIDIEGIRSSPARHAANLT